MTSQSAVLCWALVAVLASGAFADPWKLDADISLSTAINSFTDNWVGGDAGSFAWASQFLGAAQRRLSPFADTKTTLNLQFGQTETQNKTTKTWSVPQKSSDLIDGEELFRLTLNSWVDPFVSVRAISQFVDNGDSALVRYGNPLELDEALGANRTLDTNVNVKWSARLGAATRQVINRNYLDSVSGERATSVIDDGGLQVNMDLSASNKAKWISLLSSLQLYEALVSSEAAGVKGTSAANDWRQPHLKWENTLILTFAKYLMLNVSAYAYYDRDIADAIRLKETISAGVTYLYSRK